MRTALMGTIVLALAGAAAAAPAGPMGACAHRGDVRHAPENTLPAFRSAAEKGAHMIEFDVAATRDGKLVLMHDATVDRTTDGKGRVDAPSFDGGNAPGSAGKVGGGKKKALSGGCAGRVRARCGTRSFPETTRRRGVSRAVGQDIVSADQGEPRRLYAAGRLWHGFPGVARIQQGGLP